MGDLWMFVGALVVVYLIPGPDMVLILQTSAVQGRKHGFSVAAGLALARAAHVHMASLGLGALLKASPDAFEVLRLVGAAYLIWLGVKIFRASSLLADCSANDRCGSEGHWFSSLRKGLITNISNPKALLFCSVLLPQFIESGTNGVAPQFLLLGCILVITGCLFDFLYVVVGEALRGLLAKSLLARAVQRWSFASMLIGFGIRMALEERAG